MLDALNRVDHTDILAHLESCFSDRELHEFQALLPKGFKEQLRISLACFCNFDTSIEAVNGQIL
jgi:hypothetical protein